MVEYKEWTPRWRNDLEELTTLAEYRWLFRVDEVDCPISGKKNESVTLYRIVSTNPLYRIYGYAGSMDEAWRIIDQPWRWLEEKYSKILWC